MKTKVSSKGQIVLPAELRQMDGIEPGQLERARHLYAPAPPLPTHRT